MAIVPRRSFNFLDLIEEPTKAVAQKPPVTDDDIIVTTPTTPSVVYNYTPAPINVRFGPDVEQIPVSGFGIWFTMLIIYALGYGLVQQGCGQLVHLLEIIALGTTLHLRGALYRRRQ
jgi:hypothetical protein